MSGASSIETVFFDLGQTLVTSARTWVPGAREVLDKLRAKDIRMGVISNTGQLARDALQEHLPPDFDFGEFEAELVLLSSEVRIEKPDLRIFLEAIRRAGVSPSACLLCTEDLVHTLAAQRTCMRTARLVAPPNGDLGDLVHALEEARLL